MQITCGDDGNLIAPDPWPACRQQAYSCGEPPSAPDSTNLILTNTVAVSEFDEVLYECKPGFTLVNADSSGDGQIIEVGKDKMTPKLTKDQIAINKLREIREKLDARGLKSIEITHANTTYVL